ncbi:glycosyltransferase family 90 protein [Amanita thiersii Skay4041]|uniref:Glycosyltransferase family 90 protein n=1 Tax=Amanita thiersii Skay4041 TaxID=703135 RepID=A0A2A9NVD0_9AGAR|nr:glycosyltransferase family 90 protein [Amanita thiersii Skay4041]
MGLTRSTLPHSWKHLKLTLLFCVATFILTGALNLVLPIWTDFKPAVESIKDDLEPQESTSVPDFETVDQTFQDTTKAPDALLEQHVYHIHGLLEVNENGSHPIYELVEKAEKEWNEKLQRASKTLEDAVKEYRRRYRRLPPKGFDLWWSYVVEHNVQLPDEYDQIYHDIEPFWGLDPQELQRTQESLESKQDSYTIGKNQTSATSVVKYAFREGTYKQLIKGSEAVLSLLSKIEDRLPPFRAVISPHDGPSKLSDYNIKQATLEAASNGKYVKEADLPKVDMIGWVSACPPSSPARQTPLNLDSSPPPKNKTFIHDHLRSMDPCWNPNHFFYHGQFLSHNYGPAPQRTMVPEFSYCSTAIHHNIRLPTPYGWIEDIHPRSNDPDWDEKLDERLLWRGRNTGIFHDKNTRWQNSHREHLMRMSNDLNGTLSVLYPTHSNIERVGGAREYRKARINPAIMDVAFAGKPIQCPPATCKESSSIYPWREYQSIREAGNYKYVIDIDGNGWSGRFKRLLTSNSLVFKSTVYPEWYIDRIAPWVHYVPIQVDLSDLHDALIFFRGDGNGEGAHEDMARKIAIAGREWSKTFWRREDLTAYFLRLLLEYARVMSVDRDSMTYSTMDDGS